MKLFFTQCKVGSTENLNVNHFFYIWLLGALKMHHLRVLFKKKFFSEWSVDCVDRVLG